MLLGLGSSTAFTITPRKLYTPSSIPSSYSYTSTSASRPLYVATSPQQETSEAPEDKSSSSSIKQFDWSKQWYPLAIEGFTDRSKAHALMFLGNNVVLWHDKEKWNVFEDACPHRGVPLSEGRVESNGELLCSYHAWTFNGEGECTSIPQTLTKEKEKTLLPKACVKSYPVQVSQDLIWVWGSKGAPGSDVAIEAALKSPHLIEEYENPLLKEKTIPRSWDFRDLPYGWDFFMENVMDAAHVPVSHHNKQGSNRYTGTRPMTMRRIESVTEIPASLGGKMLPGYEEDAGFKFHVDIYNNQTFEQNRTIEFRPPCLVRIHFLPRRTKLILYATPTSPGYCRAFLTGVFPKDINNKIPLPIRLMNATPRWMRHLSLGAFFVSFLKVFYSSFKDCLTSPL